MSPKLPGVDVKFLANVVNRLSARRLHAYYPGTRRSAAALVLRFDESTQRSLTAALTTFQAISRTPSSRDGPDEDIAASSSSTAAAPGGRQARVDAVALLRYLQDHCVDPALPSALQLLFLKRANMDASRWSGQVAFPGGRRDPDDVDDFATVCREAQEELGLPLQHSREFVCLGRLPDYKLHRRAVSASGLVQARFVFLHVGDMTPSVQIATHEVESVRWMPLRRLTAAHVEHGCIAHPLQSFVHPQDADYRLLLTELFPSTYLTFPSVSLPCVEGEEETHPHTKDDTTSAGADGNAGPSSSRPSSPLSRSWRVWGLTLRSANELLALDNRQPFDWPLVESNSRVLQYCVLFPFHGYYELLYQYYYQKRWLLAQGRLHVPHFLSWATSKEGPNSDGDRRVLHGSAMERRYAVLPVSADALLFAVPERPVPSHVACYLGVVAAVVLLFYTVASVLADFFASVRLALGVEAALAQEERRRAYYAANVHHRSSASTPAGKTTAAGGDTTPRETEEEEEEQDDRDGDPAKPVKRASLPLSVGATANDEGNVSSPPTYSTSWWQRKASHASQGRHRTADEAALAAELNDGRGGAAEASLDASTTVPVTAAGASTSENGDRSSDSSVSTEAKAGEEKGQRFSHRERSPPQVGALHEAAAKKGFDHVGDGATEPRSDLQKKTAAAELPTSVPSTSKMTKESTTSPPPTSSTAASDVTEMSYDEELQTVMDRYRSSQ